jgi:23S rRNA pseudouridine2605 synthase
MGIRLNKYMAQCGLGSRRKVESLITAGRITINGRSVRRIGTIIEQEDRVALDGRLIVQQTLFCYLMLNKPRGYVTTLHDEKNRPTVMDLIPEKYRLFGIYPVGRLDKDTGGLLLFTNDGDLAYKLTKPSFNIPKEYAVEIDRPLAAEDRDKIMHGMYIHQLRIKTKPAQVVVMDDSRRLIGVTIREGKNRQIRYTFMNLGYKVKRLDRTSYGTLTLRNIRKGSSRVLTTYEVRSLKKLVGL